MLLPDGEQVVPARCPWDDGPTAPAPRPDSGDGRPRFGCIPRSYADYSTPLRHPKPIPLANQANSHIGHQRPAPWVLPHLGADALMEFIADFRGRVRKQRSLATRGLISRILGDSLPGEVDFLLARIGSDPVPRVSG